MNATYSKNQRKPGQEANPTTELGHVSISDKIISRKLSDIQPSPENDKLYRPIDKNDPDFKSFVETVRKNGITDPLIVTRDGYICSDHRRYAAAVVLGLDEVPTRTAEIDHDYNSVLHLE